MTGKQQPSILSLRHEMETDLRIVDLYSVLLLPEVLWRILCAVVFTDIWRNPGQLGPGSSRPGLTRAVCVHVSIDEWVNFSVALKYD